LEQLSFQGVKFEDGEPLRNRNLKDGDLFVGRMEVIVEDNDCDLATTIDNVYQFDTVTDVLRRYKELSRRNFNFNEVSVNFGEIKLDLVDNLKLYDFKIEDKSVLEFKNNQYVIFIRERNQPGMGMPMGSGSNKSSPVELTVQDHFTVQTIKQEYSRLVKDKFDALLEGDKIVFKEDYLDEKKEIYKYGIGNRSELWVEREDVTQIHIKYICADCGSEVKLKKNDAIQCRECSYRIVYKKRSNTPCQYVAR